MQNSNNKARLVFDCIRSPSQTLARIKAGTFPREFMGYIQLQDKGWPVSYSDDRWFGSFGKLRQKLISRIEIPSIKMIKHWRNADIIIVTTRISLTLALLAKALGKKIVFLDAMCAEIPKRLWRRLFAKYAIKLADANICLSLSQAKHWATSLRISENAFYPVFWGADFDYYKLPCIEGENLLENPYLLAIGRDPARDFNTLVNAVNDLGWNLKLVTKSYLVPEGVRNNPRVQILDEISYQDLFKVYAKAVAVVVPVKRNTTYMSGIRATMEAMSLGVPVIASRTSGMLDYFVDYQELVYFESENKDELVSKIRLLAEDNNLRNNLIRNAKTTVREKYTVTNYADKIEKVLLSVIRNK